MRRESTASIDMDGLGYTSTRARTYYCAGCWKRFPEDALLVVTERTGLGFRCRDCIIERIQRVPEATP